MHRFQYLFIALYCRCYEAARLHIASLRNQDQLVITKRSKSPKGQGSTSIDAATALHVIGDTHGDTNFLVRSLLSTELFMLRKASTANDTYKLDDDALEWKGSLDPRAAFEVVVLGDMVDRGLNSKRNLLLLKRLCDTQPFGSHMHVLLGNHEIMTLKYQMAFWKEYDLGDAYMRGDWTEVHRKLALRSTDGPDHELITWLLESKVAHLSDGVLLMHGGLSNRILENSLTHPAESYEESCSANGNKSSCGSALVNYFNTNARIYFEQLHKCILEAKPPSFGEFGRGFVNMFDFRHRALDCNTRVSEPAFLHGYDGLAFYRGFSSVQDGAGTQESCGEASRVGERIGVQLMVVAHSTHRYILEYCNECLYAASSVLHAASSVPIVVSDTHRLDCAENNECDFDPSVNFHGSSIDRNKGNVPQSLRVVRQSDDTYRRQSCLSRVTSDELEVDCAKIPVTDGRKLFDC